MRPIILARSIPLIALLTAPPTAQAPGPAPQTPLYRPIDLGVLPGWAQSRALDVNNKRQVTGTLLGEASGVAFVWLPRPAFGLAAGMSSLGALPVSVSNVSWASTINECGQIGGVTVGNAPGSVSTVRAFLWQDGFMDDLGSLAGEAHSWSEVTAINGKGTVVGSSDLRPGFQTNPTRAFATHVRCGDRRGADLVDLGSLNGTWSNASDVNDKDQVVGATALQISPDHTIGAPFFYDPRDGMVDLPLIAGSDFGSAIALNDRDVVVGSCVTLHRSGATERAALWRRTRTGWSIVDIGAFMGMPRNEPTGIDAQDRVVGISLAQGQLEGTSFLWVDGVLHALDDLLLTEQPVRIVRTGRMNDRGDIAAAGYNAAGEYRAFLLLRLR